MPPIDSVHLPTLNACLNGCAGVLLCIGLFFIKRGAKRAHIVTMLVATAFSAAFLTSYLYYHLVVVPDLGHTPFRRTGAIHTAYLALLVSHVLLAIINLPMILVTLNHARRRNWSKHKRWARWTWPVWFYVSVTGVLVYLALYRWNPPE